MKKKSLNKAVFLDSEMISRLERVGEIRVELIENNSMFKNDARFHKVKFGEDDDDGDGRENITCEIVNNCRKKSYFLFCFDEIKRIYDSNNILIWENPNL